MRIALTHNLRLTDSEEEAEFDSRETIDTLTSALERLGHRVERIEVSGPASRTAARLEAFAPDLIFNTAEGRRGRFREAFYPALFDELGFPYTGSDAWVLAVTLDKALTKLMLGEHGVISPRGQFMEEIGQLRLDGWRWPVIVKPNFEGSSKGITQESVIEERSRLRAFVEKQLARFPAGVLVEEFIPGKDLTVAFLEKTAPERAGVLTPVEYVIDEAELSKRRYRIYDYDLKSVHFDAVSVRCPAQFPGHVLERAQEMARKAYKALGCRDLGRIDFRVAEDGQVYFIEINALPSLEPGAGIYAAAALEGLHTDGVLAKVIESAVARWGINDARRRQGRPLRKTGPLRVGFTFNVKRIKPEIDGRKDEEAEYDAPSTVQAVREAIAAAGHEVIDLEATSELPNVLAAMPVDVVFNMAEGIKGRNREAVVPALLELLDIPYSGSDPAALSIALDKALAKRIVRQHGILTPNFVTLQTGKERLPRELMKFPLIVKPVAEGSSKGVHHTSVVETEAELRETAREMIARYDQPALVESYIAGREFTVGLLGERRPKVLPPMEVVFLAAEKHPVYSFEYKQDWSSKIRYDVPAHLEPAQLRALERAARECFIALGCRDVARVDFRMDEQGKVYFLECNPLPGLTPGWSDLVLIAKAAGIEYHALIAEILSGAIRRYKERERERRESARIVVGGPVAVAQSVPPPVALPPNGNGPSAESEAGPGPQLQS
ncbi:MAG TPA: ATP-grasp domain-containing protein [Myxococcales bacterium]|jgi:D-alanine-D-alanine ligase|nr:ATP-grasp domain-containing protein [Myxococcales bacterium]